MRDIETSDIVLAATLRVKGYKLDRLDKQNNRGTFCFSDVDEKVLDDFDLGNCDVEPVAFNNTIKSLIIAIRRV